MSFQKYRHHRGQSDFSPPTGGGGTSTPVLRLQRTKRTLQAAALLLTAFTAKTQAANITWNGGASGTWDTTTTTWASTGTPWNPTNGILNIAIFNTAGVTATVSGTVYVDGITLSANGTVTGGTISLGGTTPTINVATGRTGTISSVLAGATGK